MNWIARIERSIVVPILITNHLDGGVLVQNSETASKVQRKVASRFGGREFDGQEKHSIKLVLNSLISGDFSEVARPSASSIASSNKEAVFTFVCWEIICRHQPTFAVSGSIFCCFFLFLKVIAHFDLSDGLMY